jgi:toxin ParE1/3/4
LRRLVYTAYTRRDLASIFEYITRESHSLETGRRFTSQIREKCKNLASLPAIMGRPRPELRPDVRSFSFKNYVIFLRYEDGALQVVNVLEGHMDIEGFFGGNDVFND